MTFLILRGFHTLTPSFLLSAGNLELQPVEGNPQRGIWKACCWRMAEEVNNKIINIKLLNALRILQPVAL